MASNPECATLRAELDDPNNPPTTQRRQEIHARMTELGCGGDTGTGGGHGSGGPPINP